MFRLLSVVMLGLSLQSANALEKLNDQGLDKASASGLMTEQLNAHLPRLVNQTLSDNDPAQRIQPAPQARPDPIQVRETRGMGYARTRVEASPAQISVHPETGQRVSMELNQRIEQVQALQLRHDPHAQVDRGDLSGTGIHIQGTSTLTYQP